MQVVALRAPGYQTKQIARALGISAETAGRHVKNAYGKIGVSTRAAATLFAMGHGLATWGELPMGLQLPIRRVSTEPQSGGEGRGAVDMAVVMMVDNREGSQENYEKVRAHLGLDTPAGVTFRVAGPSPTGGFRVIEVWESEVDARTFLRERFAPAAGDRGVRYTTADSDLARAQDHDAVTSVHLCI